MVSRDLVLWRRRLVVTWSWGLDSVTFSFRRMRGINARAVVVYPRRLLSLGILWARCVLRSRGYVIISIWEWSECVERVPERCSLFWLIHFAGSWLIHFAGSLLPRWRSVMCWRASVLACFCLLTSSKRRIVEEITCIIIYICPVRSWCHSLVTEVSGGARYGKNLWGLVLWRSPLAREIRRGSAHGTWPVSPPRSLLLGRTPIRALWS